MAKNSIRDYDATNANNTDIQSIDISEGCSPAGINNAIREVMADLKDVSTGAVALESPKFDSILDGNIKATDASGTDAAGTSTTIKGGAGTGTGAGGSIIFQVADGAGSTGSSVNAHATAMTIADDGGITVAGDLTVDTNTLYVDSANNRVGIGTASPAGQFHIFNSSAGEQFISSSTSALRFVSTGGENYIQSGTATSGSSPAPLIFTNVGGTSETMRIDSSGNLLVGKTSIGVATVGVEARGSGILAATRSGGEPLTLNRTTSDGNIIDFKQDGTSEGSISVSGTAVSYNGGHLARWSQLADNTRDENIVKGTVLTNLDQMAEWTNDGVTEDNEQLNCMAVSSVEGDANVAGVFVNWDNDDEIYANDMNVAMTGDMVIRIAQGTTVQRGDLLMSAGDGTAKPQGDDIVRSKTIAKVTSTHVSHTYDDGSYLVPCVLMAC